MSAVVPSPVPDTPSRGAQAALGVFLAVLVALLAVRGYGDRFKSRPTESAPADLIDLNSADASELAQVPGIGPKTADAIAEYRRAHGPFKSVEELGHVRGIGPKTLDKVRDHLRVGALPLAPLAEAPASPPPASVPTVAPRPVVAASGARKLQPGDPPIDVNGASTEELQRLPGVGPVTAGAIVATRAAKPFASVDDLDRVKGIGPKTLDKLRPFVVVR